MDDVAVSNFDGSVTVYFGTPGTLSDDSIHLDTNAESLGELIVADLNLDGFYDIAVTAPFEGEILIYVSNGVGGFMNESEPLRLKAWRGARHLIAGNFDGLGALDLAVAGPVIGIRHFKNSRETGLPLRSEDFEPADVIGMDSITSHTEIELGLVPLRGSEREQLVVKPDGKGPIAILGLDPIPAEGGLTLWQDVDLPSELFISEISANTDSDGDFSRDWIELFNRGTSTCWDGD